MNRFKIFLACALIGITFCTTVLAQSHRHSQRNDSTENVILEENEKSATSDAYNSGYSDGEEIRSYVDEIVKDAVDEGVIVAVIAVVGVFFGPVILVAIILFFIYKRKKQRDMVVMAAINKGVDVPEGYGGSYSRNTSTNGTSDDQRSNKNTVTDDPMMHKGITNICTGLGLVVFACYLDLDILVGIGWMVVIFGVGKIAIAYLSGERKFRKEEPKYTRTIEKAVEDEKSE